MQRNGNILTTETSPLGACLIDVNHDLLGAQTPVIVNITGPGNGAQLALDLIDDGKQSLGFTAEYPDLDRVVDDRTLGQWLGIDLGIGEMFQGSNLQAGQSARA